MPLKINGSTSGSVTLAAPATGSDVTLTLPTTGFGKLLQVVRATDAADRSTTSTSFVDVTGVSVTITPQRSDSSILLVAAFNLGISSGGGASPDARFQITDSSNNAISGAENVSAYLLLANTQLNMYQTLFARATPNTTSAVTYKLRYRATGANITVNAYGTAGASQMLAFEIGA